MSTSVASTRTSAPRGASTSWATIAAVYASSPVEAAADQIFNVSPAGVRRASSSARNSSKWCGSRKNEVLLVVTALTRCAASSESLAASA